MRGRRLLRNLFSASLVLFGIWCCAFAQGEVLLYARAIKKKKNNDNIFNELLYKSLAPALVLMKLSWETTHCCLPSPHPSEQALTFRGDCESCLLHDRAGDLH